MARKTKIETEAQALDNIDASTSPAEQQPQTRTRRPRRMAREVADEPNEPSTTGTAADEPEIPSTAPRSGSKIAQVIALLEHGEGATLAELVEATGWQPHTTRAALTGLKKKGHIIRKDKRGDVTCYHIEAAA
jgi:hypothetical protein